MPYALKDRIFAESQAMGASYVRVDVQMSDIFETPNGPPDWRGLDEVIALSRRYGIGVLGVILETPTWLSTCPTDVHPGRCPPWDFGQYGNLVGRIAAHARGVVRHWQILNEPPLSWFTGTPEDYGRLLSASHDAIKQAAPEDLVVLGNAYLSHTAWAKRVFATVGARSKYDIGTINFRGKSEDARPTLIRWRDFLAQQGFRGPIWVIEHGYPADAEFQFDPLFTGGDAAQAAYLRQSLRVLEASGAAEVFVTLRHRDSNRYVSEGIVDIGPAPGYPASRKPAFYEVRDWANEWRARQDGDASAPAPANDDFANAEPLSGLGVSVAGGNVDATSEPGEPNHAGNAAGHSLWWRWTAPASGSVRVDTCNSFNFDSDFDTVLAVYMGDGVGVLSPVASNDNSPSCASLNPSGGAVVFTATAGKTYRIAVDGAEGPNDLGFVQLGLRETPASGGGPSPPPPPPPPPPAALPAEAGATAADDTLTGTPGPDLLCGLGGSDLINGLGGNDTLFGDACGLSASVARAVRAAAASGGNDRLYGGAGNDKLYGAGGRDRLFGGSGNDALHGGGGNDTLKGEAGRDRLLGDGGADRLSGGPSRDRLSGGNGKDRIWGRDGNDLIQGGKSRDRLSGGPGNDRIRARDGRREAVNCGPGRDRVRADKRDRLRGCEVIRRR